MDDRELNRRLGAADPAGPMPVALNAVIDDLVGKPARRRRRGLRVAAIGGGAVLLAGSLAAFTGLDTFLLSVPPFSALDAGTMRTAEGLPYVPVGEADHGEQCELWLDLGGLSPAQMTSVNRYWAALDPAEFAEDVNARLGSFPLADGEEELAKKYVLLARLNEVVPGTAWGTTPPGQSWAEGEPHLTSIFTTCADDLDSRK
jgi:hypothetical protein